MVSKTNTLLIGAAILLLGIGASRLISRGPDPLTQTGGEIPQAFNIIQDPEQTKALPEFLKNLAQRKQDIANIPFFEKQIQEAQQFLRQTFPKPVPRIIRHPSELRGPNAIGIFGARGVISGIDPFTGSRTIVGFSQRASGKTKAFFGDISQNFARVQFGTELQSQVNAFIAEIQTKLGLIRTNTAV